MTKTHEERASYYHKELMRVEKERDELRERCTQLDKTTNESYDRLLKERDEVREMFCTEEVRCCELHEDLERVMLERDATRNDKAKADRLRERCAELEEVLRKCYGRAKRDAWIPFDERKNIERLIDAKGE